MLDEGAEKTGVSVGQSAVGVFHQTALGGGGIAGDVPARATLAAKSAVDIQFGDMNGQAEGLQLRQRLVFLLKVQARKR